MKVADVYGEFGQDVPFQIGKANQLKDGKDLTIIACGIMVQEALEAAEMLKAKGIEARVIDMFCIKPIDREAIIAASKETGLIVTAEEHMVSGGLGGAVSEVVCEEAPCKVVRFGVKDQFGQSGTPKALLEAYKLTSADLADVCEKAFANK